MIHLICCILQQTAADLLFFVWVFFFSFSIFFAKIVCRDVSFLEVYSVYNLIYLQKRTLMGITQTYKPEQINKRKTSQKLP